MAELTGIPIPSLNWKSQNITESFRKFKQTCEFIFGGPLSEKDEDIKVQYLMLWVGEEGMDIREGWGLTDAQKKKLDVHWQKFESHVKPKSCFRVARFQLRALKQEETETVDAFITRAKVIAAECEYTDINEQLLDTLISGVKNETVQRKLISKDNTLTLDQALAIVRSFETTQAQMNDIQDTKKIHLVKKNDGHYFNKYKGEKQDRATPRQGQCWNCGRGHPRDATCPASGSECDKCGKQNHWARMCMSRRRPEDSQENTSRRGPRGRASTGQKYFDRRPTNKRVHEVVDNNDTRNSQSRDLNTEFHNFVFDSIEIDCDNTSTPKDEVNLHTIYKDQAFANIHVKGQDRSTSMTCKLDTGAQINVMPRDVYKQLFPACVDDKGLPMDLKPSSAKLKAYGGYKIHQYGAFSLQCSYKDVNKSLQFHVTEADGPTNLGLRSCLDLGLVTVHCDNWNKDNGGYKSHSVNIIDTDKSTERVAQQVTRENAKHELMDKFPDCFQGVGLFPGEYHIELRQDAEPVIQPPRRVPESLKVPLQEELQRMIDLDIIEKVDQPTDWVSSLVYVTKPNGDLRICLDPKDLNKWVKREHHYTPTIDDILPKLSGAKIFSKLDARSGYWNVKLDQESKLLTTFNTPYGRYCFKRLPFGLNSAQDVFQKKVDQTFENLPGVIGIADDIIVYGCDEQEHDHNLLAMMERTRKAGLRLNPDKCDIKRDRIKFYGNYVTATGLEPDPDKISAILNMEPPKSVTQLQSLLGMANYLGRFTPELSTITAPLRDLTKKDIEFMWHPEHQNAFEKLKSAISSSTSLAYFDPNSPVTVQADASKHGLGAALLQRGQPVAFASKSLTETESNYSNIEREMLAIVFGLERFHHYVYGRPVVVESDHRPLESITKKSLSNAPPRLMRMLLRSQRYDYTVKYIPGKDVPVADALSRTPIFGEEIPNMDVTVHELVNVSLPRLKQIKEASRKDKQIRTLRSVVLSGWPELRKDCNPEISDYWNYRDEISVHDDLILKGDRVIIPKEMRSLVLNQIHNGHQGMEKCKLRARGSVYWHGINTDIDEMVKKCPACQHHHTSQQSEPLIQIQTEGPWDIVGSDLFTWHHDNYLLVVDYYSSFPIIRRLPSTTAAAVIGSIKSIFSEYGIPETLITDNGPQYMGSEFQNFTKEYQFDHITSSPHYHQSNGKAERYVGVVKKTLQKALESNQDPSMAMLCIRTTPLGSSLPSPAKLMFGRNVQSNLPLMNKKEEKEEVATKLRAQRGKQKSYYDRDTRPLPALETGQSVRMQNPRTKRWEPALIINKCQQQPRSYIVEGQNGGSYRRNRRHIRTTGETFNFRDNDKEPEMQATKTTWDPVTEVSTTDTTSDIHPATNSNKPAKEKSPVQSGYDLNTNSTYTTRSGRSVKPPSKLDL